MSRYASRDAWTAPGKYSFETTYEGLKHDTATIRIEGESAF